MGKARLSPTPRIGPPCRRGHSTELGAWLGEEQRPRLTFTSISKAAPMVLPEPACTKMSRFPWGFLR